MIMTNSNESIHLESLDFAPTWYKICDAYDIGQAEDLPVLDLSPRQLFADLEARGYRYIGKRWVFAHSPEIEVK
jgi:hypothetical protein